MPNSQIPQASTFRSFAIAGLIVGVFATRSEAAGSDTFKENCVSCHGADGGGNTAIGKKFKVRDLRSPDVQKLSDADLTGLIVNGKSPMPPFGTTLDTAKVKELVAYLRSMASK